jgi:xylan 1,4-beta-xylosidase
VTPPRDMQKWADFIRAFTLHVQERYGHDEVKTWYFEVWNEPEPRRLLGRHAAAVFRSLRRVGPRRQECVARIQSRWPGHGRLRLGAGVYSILPDERRAVDFVSTHTYGVESGYLDETATHGTALSRNPNSVFGEVKMVRQQIAESAFPKLELHFTEWSSSYTPADPFHDSYHSAAYILDKLKNCEDAAQSMSYWTFTDIFEEPGPRWEAFHGGFGLMNYQDIKKSAYFAYQFLNRLGATELRNSDRSSWICTDKGAGVQALIWDFTNTFPGTNMINQVYYKRDLPAQPQGKVTLNLANVPRGKYTLETYKAGYRVNDAYATYRDLGAPHQLTKAQVAEIKSKNNGAPLETRTVKIGRDGKFTQQFDLRENDAVLITLKPQR